MIFVEPGFFAGAEMRARMQDEERQFELVRAEEFLGERAKRVGVKLRIRGREIDQVIRVRESRVELGALRVIEESARSLRAATAARTTACCSSRKSASPCIDRHGTARSRDARRRRSTCARRGEFRIADCGLLNAAGARGLSSAPGFFEHESLRIGHAAASSRHSVSHPHF